MTSQCAQPTVRNLFIRVCATNSTIICLKRGKKGRQRSGAGWPIRIVLTIFHAPPMKEYQHTRLSSTPIVPNVIVRAFIRGLSCRGRTARLV